MITRLAHYGGLVTVHGALQSPRSKSNLRQVLDENEEGISRNLINTTKQMANFVFFVVVDIPDVAKAIIQESEHDLNVELRSGRANVNDKIGNTTLLQLSVGWPRGIEILADAGVDMHRVYRLNPLKMAIRAHDYNSSRALLVAGHPLSPSDICTAENLNAGQKMMALLITELSNRRKRLFNIARANLSQAALAEIGLMNYDTASASIPDITASKIKITLHARGIKIDPSIESSVSPQSVYHHPFRKIEILDLLFASGFKDIDSRDPSGKTPLMIMISSSGIYECSNRRRQWLISHGADPTLSLPGRSGGGGTVLHFLGTYFASFLALEITHTAISIIDQFQPRPRPRPPKSGHQRQLEVGEEEQVDEEDPLFDLRYVLKSSVRDTCICACSLDGCTPLLTALRHFLSYSPRFYMKDGINRFGDSMNFLISRTERNEEVDFAIIRLMTFDALDLTHTCCRKSDDYMDHRIVYMDMEEVEEIRDEESGLLNGFENLLADLVLEFRRRDIPVMEFLRGPWYRKVIGHVNHVDSFDELHVEGVRGVGLELQAAEFRYEKVSLMIGRKVTEIEE